jgi:hypothetical protein
MGISVIVYGNLIRKIGETSQKNKKALWEVTL